MTTNLAPYRIAAIVHTEPVKALTKMGTGFIVREPLSHSCKRPGWWRCLFRGIKEGDLWICGECGEPYHRYKTYGDTTCCWKPTNTNHRDAMLEKQQLPNPWKKESE